MNQIPAIQNSQKQLERLAAQRELYSSAKKWHGTQIILTVILPVVLATVAFFKTEFAVIAAIFGVLSFLIDISTIEPMIKKRKTKAAKKVEKKKEDKSKKKHKKSNSNYTLNEELPEYK